MMSNDAEKAGMRWKSYFSLYDFSLILQVSLTIICSYLAVFVFLNSHIPDALAYTDIPDSFDRGDIAELFDFGSGIFAALLCALSLAAYKITETKRMLFVSIAFGLFAILNYCITYRPFYARGRILDCGNGIDYYDLCSAVFVLYSLL